MIKSSFLMVMGGVLTLAAVGAQSDTEQAIVPIDSVRRGEFVVVRGQIARYRDYDEFVLRDASGRIAVFLGGGRPRTPIAEAGDTVTVHGWVDDALIDVRREIYATEIVLDDGSVVTLERNPDW